MVKGAFIEDLHSTDNFIRTHIHTHTHTYTRVIYTRYMHMHACVHTCTCTCVHTHADRYTRKHAHTHVVILNFSDAHTYNITQLRETQNNELTCFLAEPSMEN